MPLVTTLGLLEISAMAVEDSFGSTLLLCLRAFSIAKAAWKEGGVITPEATLNHEGGTLGLGDSLDLAFE